MNPVEWYPGELFRLLAISTAWAPSTLVTRALGWWPVALWQAVRPAGASGLLDVRALAAATILAAGVCL